MNFKEKLQGQFCTLKIPSYELKTEERIMLTARLGMWSNSANFVVDCKVRFCQLFNSAKFLELRYGE